LVLWHPISGIVQEFLSFKLRLDSAKFPNGSG
jgi:hypothetical protein